MSHENVSDCAVQLHQLTALGVSASQGERDSSRRIVKMLLEHGADVRITTKVRCFCDAYAYLTGDRRRQQHCHCSRNGAYWT